MNRLFKRCITITVLSLLIIFMLSNNFTKKASADSIPDATISTDTSVTTSSTNRAPVSIVNYSDEVTESSDTYDYSKKYTVDTDTTTYTEPTIEPTSAPYTDTNSNTTTTEPAVTATVTPTTQPNTTSKIIKKIFIGDSRTVGMQQTIGSVNGVVWSCKSAMGLSWMKSTGVPNIENQITSGTAVIILMGVNDLYNTNNYIQYINQKSTEWASKGAVTYYVSVNPINESTYKGFKNTKIETFNNTMQSGLKNVNYIDTYNYLITHECNYTSDGLHYKTSTSKKIYELINQNIQ